MALIIIKMVFVILSSVSGYIIVQNVSEAPTVMQSFQGIALGLAVPIVIIALEAILRKFFLDAVAGIIFGIMAGFILSFIILQSLDLIMPETVLLNHLKVPVILVVCYVVVALVLQTKDKFKFIVPYIDFRSSGTVPDYLILDSSAVIDGRIFSLIKMGLFPEKIIIPQFVVDELQVLSDSQDKQKRERGKKALNTIRKIREDLFFNIDIHYDAMKGYEGVDAKIVALGHQINGRVVTTDANLEKVASIEGVKALNVNELATAFRPDVMAGDEMQIEIIKTGETGKQQGVGYLPEGTMVVVEDEEKLIGETLDITVTNSVQTSTGRMIFARIRV